MITSSNSAGFSTNSTVPVTTVTTSSSSTKRYPGSELSFSDIHICHSGLNRSLGGGGGQKFQGAPWYLVP